MTPYTDNCRLLHCDYCHRSEAEPIVRSLGRLPMLVMYKLDNQCLICQDCLERGWDCEPDFLVDAEGKR